MSGLGLVVVNKATGEPIVFVGQTAALSVRIDNDTGGDLRFATGAGASTLRLDLPDFYTVDDGKRMSIALPGWDFAFDDRDRALVLTCRSDPGPLAQGHSLAIEIAGATSAGPPDAEKQLTLELANVSGNVPPGLPAPLVLAAPPVAGNPKLPDTLQVSLEHQGVVYVSAAGDVLSNTIVLNLKNTEEQALYTGPAPRPGDARVKVTFVYGTTSGALAPDANRRDPSIGSAWGITAELQDQQGGAWTVENPGPVDPHPQWILKPSGTNQNILGAGSEANATFVFREIVSRTPPGHTQMIVHLTGFARDAQARYDDAVYVLDIIKQLPPPTRGLLSFFASEPIVTVTRPDQPITIDLRWRMLGVSRVKLLTTAPGAGLWSKCYPKGALLADDRHPLTRPGVSSSTPIFLSLQAYDGAGVFLNSLPFAVFIDAQMLVDPLDEQRVYPVMRSGNRLWMAANLRRPVAGARPVASGKLYPASLAADNIPSPWRLPQIDDWKALVGAFPSPEAAYAALKAGGPAGFNATLDGRLDRDGRPQGAPGYGYYWSATPDAHQDGSRHVAAFSGVSGRVNLDDTVSGEYFLAVRWVRDV